MICQKCNKNNASVLMKQSSGGKDVLLCEACMADIQINMIIESVLPNALNKAFSTAKHVEPDIKCPQCKTTVKGIKKAGTLGCVTCYETFKDILHTLLTNAHAATVHTGKIPKRTGELLKYARHVDVLKTHMKQAVTDEDYSRAAFIRDQIKRIDSIKCDLEV